MRVRAAITVSGPQDEVERRWRELQGDAKVFRFLGSEHEDGIRFQPAPGDRGTEVHVDLEQPTFGGALGEKVQRVVWSAPEQEADEALRSFKQVVETAAVVRSDGSPGGTDPKKHRTQRPAQPLGEPVGAGS